MHHLFLSTRSLVVAVVRDEVAVYLRDDQSLSDTNE